MIEADHVRCWFSNILDSTVQWVEHTPRLSLFAHRPRNVEVTYLDECRKTKSSRCIEDCWDGGIALSRPSTSQILEKDNFTETCSNLAMGRGWRILENTKGVVGVLNSLRAPQVHGRQIVQLHPKTTRCGMVVKSWSTQSNSTVEFQSNVNLNDSHRAIDIRASGRDMRLEGSIAEALKFHRINDVGQVLAQSWQFLTR